MSAHPLAFYLFLLFAILTDGHRAPPCKKLDPTNAAGSGSILNSTRLVLTLECTDCPVFDIGIEKSWKSNDATLIYDLTMSDTRAGNLVWTHADPVDIDRRIPFFPPVDFGSLSPFQRGLNLLAPPSTTVSEYLDGAVESVTPLRVPGAATSIGIANPHRWNISRISYINGLAYTGPGKEIFDIAVVLVYLFQNGTQPVEIVWWEIQDIDDYHKDTSEPQLPTGLELKLLGVEESDYRQQEEEIFITLGVAALCVLLARLVAGCFCGDGFYEYDLLEKDEREVDEE
ncbi:uncharacterized protein LTHEOB_4430 [Lasiodiplodia theobromae]|uniref:uncharacterized protein n=1 Tax=Lasiodiplodia theobromae TaxID=45133 RepID=UPI0015C2EF81|nr:uncharacterized protein LTHEOB_4430 [Lasiodiplodia theobromae]KAF4546433.1 hypothetical protein LTHEOB_4430 [Lasiodiplodia theobromae]